MRLSALDGTFVELEDADPSAHMHIGGLLVLHPEHDAAVPTLDELAGHLARRIGALPLYAKRLSGAAAGLQWPEWVDDPDFDLRRHLSRVALPAPGGWEELLEWAGGWFSHRLDRSLPLWEIVVVEGLADGRWALATKTHHCLCDGVGALDVAHLLFDVRPEPTHVAPPPPAAAESAARHRLPGFELAARALAAARHPLRTLESGLALADLVVHEEVLAAPDCSLNAPIGPRRRLQAAAVDLSEVKTITEALGGTVNDVVLAAVAGGLRALLEHRGEPLPDQGLRAMVPMNMRREDEHDGRPGNRISSLFVDLPVVEGDALRTYELVRSATEAVKSSREPRGADALLGLTELAPPLLHSVVARSLFAKRLFNLTVTNVPGPQVPLYVLGSRLEAAWPLVPLAADHALGVAVLSYAGRVMFGMNADADAMPDLDVFAEGLTRTLQDLQSVAHALAS